MKSALLVIDFQNAVFVDPPAFEANAVLRRIQGLIAKARAAAAPVIYVQHDEVGSAWESGSNGWAFPDEIAPQAGDYVSPKSACDAFRHGDLARHLAEQEIGRVFVCGYATEFCIDTNVRRAASLGVETVVVEDAHTTRDRPHLDARKIIEHHNWIWGGFSNPGNPIKLCASQSVQYSGA
ncbi:isochorismatase family protein [Burkholderia sp. MR1-5-21]